MYERCTALGAACLAGATEPRDATGRAGGTVVAVLRVVTVRLGIAALALAALAGCPVGHGDDDVTEDAGGDGDAGTGAGVRVTWAVQPEVPGPASATVTVSELRLQCSSLRLIGDVAPPGDPRTSRGAIDLRWRRDQAPMPVVMASAPPGLYSRLELGVGGADEHLTIKGEATVGGVTRPFEIEDERRHGVTLALTLTLAPGRSATIPVSIDVGVVLAAVPFADLDVDDGTLVFDDDDPRLDAVWAALDLAITVPPVAGAAP